MAPWPACASAGCRWPGILKFEFDDSQEGYVAAFVCPFCVGKVPELLREMAAARKAAAAEDLLRHGGDKDAETAPEA